MEVDDVDRWMRIQACLESEPAGPGPSAFRFDLLLATGVCFQE
jgi:hypothetical protein